MTVQHTRSVARPVAGSRLPVTRSVLRLSVNTAPPRLVSSAEGPSRRDVLQRWEELEWWSCAYCDASFSEMVVAEVDHIRPVAKGGCDDWENLNPSCQQCNRAKSDLDMSDWLTVCAAQKQAERDVSDTQRDFTGSPHTRARHHK
ncbi:HNH endonuclease [Streptomyces sp. NPDC003027]